MQNLIIVNNDINYIQNMLQIISDSIDNIRLYSFFTNNNSRNLLNKINNKDIDIIFITLDEVGLNILNYLVKNNIRFYQKSVILLYENIDSIKNILNKNYEKYIFKCIKKSNNLEILLKTLRYLVYVKENTYEKTVLESKIEKNLLKIGFSKNNIGTKYIIEIILYLCENKIEKFKLNNIYLILSKKYNKSPNTIKCAIQLAKDTMCKTGNKEIITNYFNYFELVEYPTVTEIITSTIEKL